MTAILRSLELGVREEGEVLSVSIPSFRPDLKEEMDLIEEVARIYGYEHIPTTVPGHITGAGRVAPEMAFEARVRELLTAAGLFEGISYSLIDCRLLELMLLPEDAPERTQLVPMRNPKSEDYTHLRPSMFVSMLETLRDNARRNITDVQLFELGHIFRNVAGGFRFNYAPRDAARGYRRARAASGETAAGAARGRHRLDGPPVEHPLGRGQRGSRFLLAERHSGAVLHRYGGAGRHLRPRRASVAAPRALCGSARRRARASPPSAKYIRAWRSNFDLPLRAYLAEIDIDALMDLAGVARAQPSYSRFPAVARDIAFLVPRNLPADQVQQVIRAAAGPFSNPSNCSTSTRARISRRSSAAWPTASPSAPPTARCPMTKWIP